MLDHDEKKTLVKHFSGRSRRALLVKSRLLVAKKYDNKGNPVEPSEDGKLTHRQVFDLTLKEARFLKSWKENGWDFDKACKERDVDPLWAKKFSRSLDAQNYQKEDERDEILAQIPTKTWITARYTAASLGLEKPDDNQKWGIDRVKEVVIPRTNVNVHVGNILQLPALSPEQESALRQLGDSIATSAEQAA